MAKVTKLAVLPYRKGLGPQVIARIAVSEMRVMTAFWIGFLGTLGQLTFAAIRGIQGSGDIALALLITGTITGAFFTYCGFIVFENDSRGSKMWHEELDELHETEQLAEIAGGSYPAKVGSMVDARHKIELAESDVLYLMRKMIIKSGGAFAVKYKNSNARAWTLSERDVANCPSIKGPKGVSYVHPALRATYQDAVGRYVEELANIEKHREEWRNAFNELHDEIKAECQRTAERGDKTQKAKPVRVHLGPADKALPASGKLNS